VVRLGVLKWKVLVAWCAWEKQGVWGKKYPIRVQRHSPVGLGRNPKKFTRIFEIKKLKLAKIEKNDFQ